MTVLVERDSRVDRRRQPDPPERPGPLQRQRRVDGAASELDVLVLDAETAELDRVRLRAAERNRETRSDEKVARGRDRDTDLSVRDAVEALRSVVDVAVGRVVGIARERPVVDPLVLDLVGNAEGQQDSLVQPVRGREVRAIQREPRAVLVGRDERDRTLGRDVGALGDVRRAEGAVGCRQPELPGAAGKELSFGLSAGEIGVGSGGSGVGGRRDREREEQEGEEGLRRGPRHGQARARAFSRTLRNWSQLPPVTSPTNFPRASYTRTYGRASSRNSEVA